MKVEKLVLEQKVKNEPEIYFTSYAYIKLQAFLKTEFAKSYEFMVIGEVERNKNTYYITNLHIIPQCKNSSSYCETDDEKYAAWLQETFKPEERKLVRLHGHSHVNMSTSPSGTDNENVLNMMKYVKDYFIQIIFNLKKEITINLYQKEDMLIYKNLPYKIILNNDIVFNQNSGLFENIKPLKEYKPGILDNAIIFKEGFEFDMATQQLFAYDENILISAFTTEPINKEEFKKLTDESQKELIKYKPKSSYTYTYSAYNDEDWNYDTRYNKYLTKNSKGD